MQVAGCFYTKDKRAVSGFGKDNNSGRAPIKNKTIPVNRNG